MQHRKKAAQPRSAALAEEAPAAFKPRPRPIKQHRGWAEKLRLAALLFVLAALFWFTLRSHSESIASELQERVEEKRSGGLACCSVLVGARSDASLLRCVNKTAGAARAEVMVVTQIVGASVTHYGARSALVNAIWAEQHNYSFRVVGAAVDQPASYDSRYGKVSLLRSVMDELLPLKHSQWVLWLDADAVIVHTSWSIDDAVTAKHASDDTHIIVCAEANMETNTRMNSGVMFLRVSKWTSEFLDTWWSHPDAAIGAPDQWTFDMLWDEDAMEVRRHTAILPATTFNSEPPFYGTWTSGSIQPVIHLMGDADSVRARIFDHLAASLCEHSAPQWPPTIDTLLRLMHDQYTRDLEDGSKPVLTRAHSAERLGMIMGHLGRDAERAELVARSLAWRESVFGADSQEVAHDVQVLANLLSILGRHSEAVPLAMRALHMAERSVDPKGRPQLQLVAAAHGDLGSLFGRMGDHQWALHHLQRCLQVEESIWGADNPHSADTHYNIALTMQLRGDMSGAVVHFKRALQMYRRFHGDSHPSVERATQRLQQLDV
jgi:Tetratricopeptide repeat/galactosyl transferase GMA12/MNN10 family